MIVVSEKFARKCAVEVKLKWLVTFNGQMENSYLIHNNRIVQLVHVKKLAWCENAVRVIICRSTFADPRVKAIT